MILKLSCPDQKGLVAGITGYLARHGANIIELAQFTDPITRWFFMRASFDATGLTTDEETFRSEFAEVARPLEATWRFRGARERIPTAILVTREGHCLRDLLARTKMGELRIDVKMVLSNHEHLRPLAEAEGVPFHCLPIRAGDKEASFDAYRKTIDEGGAKLVVLARFMQILPPGLCDHWEGHVINIHHSFLPAFAGAKPYRQAFERGVKIIGATSHYVTSDLDAGPIIEQEVMRVEHYHTPNDLRRLGRDCECLALSRAVRYHAHDRVLIHGNKTIVLRD